MLVMRGCTDGRWILAPETGLRTLTLCDTEEAEAIRLINAMNHEPWCSGQRNGNRG